MIFADTLHVARPTSLKAALRALREDPTLAPLAGGTDVFVFLNARVHKDTRYLDLTALDKLAYVKKGKRELVFGALTTFTDCIRSRAVHKILPSLVAASREVGGVQIQNRGTLAGNIANGSPAADGVPVLMAADAIVVLQSIDGEREIPLAEYYTGYRASVRKADELITEIRVPLEGLAKQRQYFRKVGTRAAQAISKVVVAAIGDRIAFGSVAATVVRARHVEAYLAGGNRDVAEAQTLLQRDIHPIDDVRSTADYRRRVAANLLAEVLT